MVLASQKRELCPRDATRALYFERVDARNLTIAALKSTVSYLIHRRRFRVREDPVAQWETLLRAIDELSEDRLHRVEQEVRRVKFDSRIRSWRTSDDVSAESRLRETENQDDRLVGLMEVLAERITGLDRKTRNLTEEMRRRDRRDRRIVLVVAAIMFVGLLVGGARSLIFTIETTPMPGTASDSGKTLRK
jgi:hypothetical protein